MAPNRNVEPSASVSVSCGTAVLARERTCSPAERDRATSNGAMRLAGRSGKRPGRSLLRSFLLLALITGLLADHRVSAETKSADTRKRPNIVFILADDMGWADIGYHGSQIRTPHLDQLARGGVRFTHHYVMATCTPTRVGFMSGRYPSRFGVLSPAYGTIFTPETLTLPGALCEVGYQTAISGKWHMGGPPKSVPLKCGFTRSYGYFHGQIDPYTHLYKTGERCWHRNDKLLDEPGHATDLITAEAVRVIEGKGSEPLFLYVAYSVPHYPLDEPDEWVKPYESKIESKSRRWYAASITHMDAGIGKIVDALERKGLRKDTLIVFASDNGGQKSWHSAKHYKGRYADKPHKVLGDNKPLRGWKGQLYEGGIRVPALANWPGVLASREVSAPVHIVDWMPTLCGLAGWKPETRPRWDGRDIWPVVSGKKDDLGDRTLYWHTPAARAVRAGDWKLIVGKQRKKAKAAPKVELFNLRVDPYEKNNLAKTERRQVSRLRATLERIAAVDRSR